MTNQDISQGDKLTLTIHRAESPPNKPYELDEELSLVNPARVVQFKAYHFDTHRRNWHVEDLKSGKRFILELDEDAGWLTNKANKSTDFFVSKIVKLGASPASGEKSSMPSWVVMVSGGRGDQTWEKDFEIKAKSLPEVLRRVQHGEFGLQDIEIDGIVLKEILESYE